MQSFRTLSSAWYRGICRRAAALVVFAGVAASALAQNPAPASGQPPTTPGFEDQVVVVGITPLPGLEQPATEVPAPVQTASAQALEQSGALDVADFLNRQFTSIHINDTQNNPFQPDVNYRGYTASPLLGTPQGLSVYMDGVRLNQPFGETVSWDLIPRLAIQSTTLMPGSNPLFGLNTLGGALSLQTKDGRTAPGTTAQATFGSSLRRSLELEHGGVSTSKRVHWYGAGMLFKEDGWRDESPSDVRQLFGKVGWLRDAGSVTLSAAHSSNALNGNGLQDFQALARDYTSIYTKPDTTRNRSTLVNLTTDRRVGDRLSLVAHAYYRHLHADTLNGDINEESLTESLYQPGAAERVALAAAGYSGVPATGLDAGNTPFPSLRCLANVLLNDEPAEKCNGLINRTNSAQHNGGISGQLVHRGQLRGRQHRLTVGAGLDRSSVHFMQSTELGYLNPDRSVTGVGAFADGASGGTLDGAPYDARVDLSGDVTTWSLFATDTLAAGARAHVTLSGRFNRTTIDNRDAITPGGGEGSLDGRHRFARFNPSAGVTLDVTAHLNAYAGYSEGSRAATSIELGCADPTTPCKLPNAMTGDPPLNQVVTRTIEAGVRGGATRLSWNAGLFAAANHDDILFVMSDQTGFGYFRNFGRTRRAGLELGLRSHAGRLSFGGGYTWLRATFESAEQVVGDNNSGNDTAQGGAPGLDGAIAIAPGDRLPFVPAHMLKVFGSLPLAARLDLDVDLIATSRSFARGNENNRHAPDGRYYLGEGTADGYAIVNLDARYGLTKRLQVIGQVSNLFDRRYASGAELGVQGFTTAGTFLSRPFPAVNGEFPLLHTTFLAPGAPRRGWLTLRVRF